MTPPKAKGFGQQIITVAVTVIVTAFLTLLLKSGAVEEKQARGALDISSLNAKVEDIRTNGSPVLRTRVDETEKRLDRLEGKVDDIWRVTVLKTAPRRLTSPLK